MTMKNPHTADQRFFLFPKQNLLAMFPPVADVLVLKRVDINKQIDESNLSYFYVTSTPPRKVFAAETMSYQITYDASETGYRFDLEKFPQGMTMTPTGLIEFNIPQTARGSYDVVVAITAPTGEKHSHGFELIVTPLNR